MRLGRFRFTLRQMMVALAFIGLVLACAARYYECNSIADKHMQNLIVLYKEYPFARTDTQNKIEIYYEYNYIKYKQAAIYPWVRVQHRFVPFDDAGP